MKKLGIKVFTLVISAIMIASVGLSGCASSTTATTATTKASGGKTIAFSLKTITNDDFQKAIADSIQAAVEGSGNKFELVTAGDQTNVANQVKQLEDLIAKKVDAIILSPMDANAVIPALKKAKEAKIPVILVDQTIAAGNEDLYVTYIGTDNFNAGKEAGKKVAEWLGNAGNVMIVRGANGSSAGDQRVDGFKAGIEGSKIEIIGEQAGDWKNDKAMQVTENMLQSNGDVQAIFTASEVMVDGILQALLGASKTGVKIMAVDGSKKAVDLIESGELTGTMAQFPQKMGQTAVDTLLGVLDGSIDASKVEKYIDSGTAAYTKDNLADAKKTAF